MEDEKLSKEARRKCLLASVQHGNAANVRWMVEEDGADVNTRIEEQNNMTLLHLAVHLGKTEVASTKHFGTTSATSGITVERLKRSLTLWRKRKPRPLPPSEPEPQRMIGVVLSAVDVFSTDEASLLRWARTSDRIQLRSQSGLSCDVSSMKSLG